MSAHLTNPKIEQLALRLGVPMNTLYQWRRRGVSLRWRIKIVQASKGAIKLSDFPDAEPQNG